MDNILTARVGRCNFEQKNEKFNQEEKYIINMNALIDLTKCREHLTINIGGRDHQIKLCGTIEDPYFCGRDACEVLGYGNIQKALYENVKPKHKQTLQTLVQPGGGCTSLGSFKPLTYNEGKSVYINESGLYSLINGSQNFKNKKEFKQQVEKWIVDLRYGEGGGLMDIFTFVKGYNLAFDITSDWFQDLWYPLSKSQPIQLDGLKKVNFQPIIVTTNLLNWMGFKGKDNSIKQFNFSKVLRSHEIPYDEIGYVRLNTENAEVVRDYYLNLEESMFAYGEYTMNYLIDKTERTRKIQDSQLTEAMEKLAIKDKEVEDAEERAKQAEEARIKAERKSIRINKFMKRITIKERKLEWIYIATKFLMLFKKH
jgi:hypothetical protein